MIYRLEKRIQRRKVETRKGKYFRHIDQMVLIIETLLLGWCGRGQENELAKTCTLWKEMGSGKYRSTREQLDEMDNIRGGLYACNAA